MLQHLADLTAAGYGSSCTDPSRCCVTHDPCGNLSAKHPASTWPLFCSIAGWWFAAGLRSYASCCTRWALCVCCCGMVRCASQTGRGDVFCMLQANEPRGAEGIMETKQAYEFTLDTIGQDIHSGLQCQPPAYQQWQNSQVRSSVASTMRFLLLVFDGPCCPRSRALRGLA